MCPVRSVTYVSGRSRDLSKTGDFPSVRSQSAFIGRVAENRNQHCPCRSHAIVADSVGIALKGQLDITVAKQSLYRFRIGLDADEERGQAVTQIVEAESPRIIVYQSAFVVPVR